MRHISNISIHGGFVFADYRPMSQVEADLSYSALKVGAIVRWSYKFSVYVVSRDGNYFVTVSRSHFTKSIFCGFINSGPIFDDEVFW